MISKVRTLLFLFIFSLLSISSAFASIPMSPEDQASREEMAKINKEIKPPVKAKKKRLTEEEIAVGEAELAKQTYGEFGPLRFARGITVTTTPLLGLKSAFNAGDLLYQYPTMNEDLILLQQRHYLEHRLESIGSSLSNRAIVAVSGAIEAQLLYINNFNGTNSGDIALSTVELDIAPYISDWADGLISFDYASFPAATGIRQLNSVIYLSRGFLTIGNLHVSPLYFTLGQIYAPFGRYSTATLTSPLTKSMGRVLTRALVMGYYNEGLYAELYGYQGNDISHQYHLFRQGGLNIGYQNETLDYGAGFLTNIADSQGMQNNGIIPEQNLIVAGTAFTSAAVIAAATSITEFSGFGVTPGGNELKHSVPGVDAHIEYNFEPFALIVEYLTATRTFSSHDLTFNGHTALVSAMHSELDYITKIYNKTVTFALAYEQSWQALALNLPRMSYVIAGSTSIWKNTMIGLEYRHDINYHPTALYATTGATFPQKIGGETVTTGLPVTSANVGGTRNLITFQLGAYF